MRIQETDRVLKESRYARATAHHHAGEGMMTRAWRMMSSLPGRMTSIFRKH